jgi:diguanylate cyclase (GGDEF)-like protein
LLKQSEVVEDCVCVRLGGDEFVVLLPTTATEQARQVAEQVRLQVESETAQHGPRTSTVSIGIAAGSAQPKLSALLQLADEALYRAKSKGRNLVQASDEDATDFQLEQSRINSRRFRREHAPSQTIPG